ncbi:hypothetical protein [Pseudomonas akapageensis]|uniref:hypothetical protein n=1 Tax=Pseudomonas akapageensis TaxID=2609961 RepID=UPI00140B5429|nr:hypothetical protein [Pseudomonas akapageensis]
MSCLICAGTAENILAGGEFEERDCPSCGRYRISCALVLMLMEQGQIFDVHRMRVWLAAKREFVDVPSIEIHEALLVL